MADIETVKTGIFEMLQRNTWKDIDNERHKFQTVLNDALKLLKEQQAEIERLKEQKPNRMYTVVQIRQAFTKAIHDLVKSPLADEMYFHLMGKTEYNLSEMAVSRNDTDN